MPHSRMFAWEVFNQQVDIASGRIEIVPQHRSEQAQFPNTPGTTKRRELPAVECDQQYRTSHAPTLGIAVLRAMTGFLNTLHFAFNRLNPSRAARPSSETWRARLYLRNLDTSSTRPTFTAIWPIQKMNIQRISRVSTWPIFWSVWESLASKSALLTKVAWKRSNSS